MGSSKSPGNDGLTKEFYVCFFKDVGQYLIDALNLSFDYNMLSTSQRQVVITLVEKKGKDKRYIKNWRQISLINVDTKIISKSLALGIKKVLSSLIHSDQTAYVKDRYIGESERLINDVLEFIDHEKIEAILFSADFEKAFNSIDHSFLFSVLKYFGFGDEFIQWVRTLLNNAESCVINNGHSTGYFLLERGTRQGDPLSAYLFILALEMLFIQIKNNWEIHGAEIDDVMIKLSAYADDTYFFTLDSESLQIILKVCKNFSEYSTLKLNVEKSEACWIGSAKGGTSKPADCNASINSKHQHPPWLTPREFFKVVKFPAPGRKFLRNYSPRAKNRQNPAPGDNFVDLQDNFAMIVKPFAFFWYSSLAWLSSSFFKDY